MNIDIERLMDLVIEENDYYADYTIKAKNLYNGDYDSLNARKESLAYANQCNDRAQSATQAVTEVLQLDREQLKRLYIAARAVNRWYRKTKYQYCIPDTMKASIQQFIFS